MTKKSVADGFVSVWREAAAFLFDFDGVLADSEPLFRESWNSALQPWGHSITSGDYWKYWSSLGEGLDGEISRCGLSGIDIPLARSRQKEFYEEFVNEGMVPLFPGAAELLEMMSSREKTSRRTFCIASNTPCNLIRKILTHGGAPVPLIIGGDHLRKKPSPEIFLKASSLLGISPESGLVFEDSWKGVMAARAGGFKSVLVLNRYNRKLDIRSDYVINGIKPILDLVSERSEL